MAGFSNTSSDRMKTLREAGKEARTDQLFGGLGRWPNEEVDEEIPCALVAMSLKEDDNFTYRANGAEVKVPAFTVRFTYTYFDDPDGPFDWSGQYFTIPYDIGSLPESDTEGKRQTQANITLGRLKGSLAGLLGDDFIEDDIVGAINLAAQRIADANEQGAQLMVSVFKKFETRKYVPKVGPKKGEEQVFHSKLDSIRGLV